ncbi:MAG: ATP-binding protein [Acidimicrobiales bacterium]
MNPYDDLPDAVLQLDPGGVVADANRAALRLLGSDPIGRPVGEACDPRTPTGQPLCEAGLPPSARLRSVTRIADQPVVVRTVAGERTVQVAGAYLRGEDGRLLGALLSLRPPARRAHPAANPIEIVSTVSHELRSPLTSVKGYTSLLLNRWDRLKDEQKKMMLEQVNHDADRVTRLITELLDISRLELGRLVLRRQMVDVRAVASSVVEKVAMDQPDLDATIVVTQEIPKVYADPDKVEQVLTNLVENACKYASPTGLRIAVEMGDERLVVSVSDRGEGISAADLPQVFRKFFRRDLSKPTGTGLGLWISRGLVEAHGGKLTASSIEGQGTTFTFTLPLVELEEVLAGG